MSAYSQQIDAARDRNSVLFKQIQRAILKVAGYIVAEEPAGTPRHAARLDWARQIRYGSLSQSEDHAARMVPMTIENATIAAALVIPDGQAVAPGPSDSDVQWVVETNLNNYLAGSA